MSLITYPATFNNYSLPDINGLTVLATDPYKPPKRVLSISDIARSDSAKLNSAFYRKKVVTVTVALQRATRGLLETSIDSLMSILQGQEKELVLQQSNTNRKYICTLADVVVNRDGGAYVELDLVFECSDRFGYDTAATLLAQVSGYTSYLKTTQITVDGSAPWQVPLIIITYTAITDGTSKTVTVGNDANGQQLTITRTWAAGDVITIDSKNKSVKVNGVEFAAEGAIPEWARGVGYITVTDNFTARTYSMTMTYVKRYV